MQLNERFSVPHVLFLSKGVSKRFPSGFDMFFFLNMSYEHNIKKCEYTKRNSISES